MSIEFGVFNEEGLVEGQLYSLREGAEAIHKYRVIAKFEGVDEHYDLLEVCLEHEDQPAEHCEECWEEEDE